VFETLANALPAVDTNGLMKYKSHSD